jgi:hypothetical protein
VFFVGEGLRVVFFAFGGATGGQAFDPLKQLTQHGETSSFEMKNLSWAVQDTGCLASSVPTFEVRRRA